MAQSLSIRKIVASDKTDWARLWKAYLEFYETSLKSEVYDETFTRLIGNNPHDFCGFLAEVDDKPVGLAHFLFHRHGWHIENTCYLQDLYADPSVRGMGVGRALIEAVYEAADEQGAASVYWLTQEFNTTARQLYDRVGKLTPFVKYARA
ncbi:MAG: GNAT family N-acetyltransferase [Paracoccaceae bacterium]